MTECYKCGIINDKATLYEGISVTGIVNVCRKCYFKQKMPLLEHKEIDWAKVDRPRTVIERLNRMSGFKKREEVYSHKPTKKDQELRALVEKNFQDNSLLSSAPPEDLIQNFNWVIMRKRRALKLSLKDFANRIYVPESIADSIERGILPKDYKTLIRKVENSLDINLFIERKFKIRPEDLVNEAKISSGLSTSEIKDVFVPKKENMFYDNQAGNKINNTVSNLVDSTKKIDTLEDNYEIDANKLNLENVENMFGTHNIKENSKKESMKLDSDDIKKFAWGN